MTSTREIELNLAKSHTRANAFFLVLSIVSFCKRASLLIVKSFVNHNCLTWRFILSVAIMLLTVFTVTSVSRGVEPAHAIDLGNGYTVRTYASPDPDSVNSHLIETPNGVVVISAQRLFSEADKAIARVNRIGKPVLAIVVTVPHTDHFGGLTRWLEAFPDADVYAAEATVESMRTDREGYIASRKEAIGDDFPSQEQVNAALPNEIVEDGAEITVDGLTLRFINLSNNNAPINTLVYLSDRDVLFSSEVVEDSITVFLKDADLDNWLQQLDFLEDSFADTAIIYPAHGTPGPPQPLIAEARAHLTMYRNGIDEALVDNQLVDEAEAAELVSDIESAYPDYVAVARLPREQLVSLNVRWQAEKRSNTN